MATVRTANLLRHLRQWAGGQNEDPVSDRELLRRFAQQRDEAAFTTLVQRHGPMVLSVCRRILHRPQDADDAFQATFLVLLRKSATHFWRDNVGGWLHRVATRVALRLRADAARQPLSSANLEESREADPLQQLTVRELLAAFDEELAHLPTTYREPLVLCCLEGKTQEETARQLDRSLSTIRRRLERGRQLLHRRLTRRGLSLPLALGMILLPERTNATIPTPLRAALSQAISGNISPRVAELVAGMARMGLLTPLRTIASLFLMTGVLAAGVGLAAPHLWTTEPPQTAANTEPEKPRTEKTEGTDFYGDPLPPGALARMGSVQLRHEGAHLGFSADGKTLISLGWDGVARFWDMGTGRQARQTSVRRPKSGDAVVALSPNGKIAVLFNTEAFHLRDTTTGQELQRLPTDGVGHPTLSFSGDGKRLAVLTGLRDKWTIRLWHTSSGKELLCLDKLSLTGRTLLLSLDGSRLAYEAKGGMHVCDAATGKLLGKGPVEGWCFAFSPDGQTLAAAKNFNNETTVTLWETAALKKRMTLRPANVTKRIIETPCLTFSPDGKLLVMGGLEALVAWDVATGKEQRRLDDRRAKRLVFSGDGKTLACAGQFEIRLWNIETGERLHARAGHDAHVTCVAASPDGRIVASIAGHDPIVQLWEAATGKPLPPSLRHESYIRSCAFTPDGRLLLAGGFGVVRLLDANTGAEERRFVVPDRKTGKQGSEIHAVHLSADRKRLAVISKNRRPALLTLWDAQTSELLTQRSFSGWLGSCFTPDGEGVTVDGRRQLTIEDTRTGRQIAAIPGDLGHPTAFSFDGQFLAVGIRRSEVEQGPEGGGWVPLGVRIVEMASRQEIFHVDGWVDYTAFTPDGRRLVTSDPEGIRLWDIETGELLLRRPWPANSVRRPMLTPVSSLAFLPNGRALVTGINDGTLLVWDMTPPARKTEHAKLLSDKELALLWADLAGDARKAYRAIHTLTTSETYALSLLQKNLQPAVAVDAKRVDQLLMDLDSEQFPVRDAAARELEGMGEQIEPMLRRVLENKPSLEVRNRVQAIQAALQSAPPASKLRTLRAIRLLERLDSVEARRLLHKLTEGAAADRVTRAAKAALDRLERQSLKKP